MRERAAKVPVPLPRRRLTKEGVCLSRSRSLKFAKCSNSFSPGSHVAGVKQTHPVLASGGFSCRCVPYRHRGFRRIRFQRSNQQSSDNGHDARGTDCDWVAVAERQGRASEARFATSCEKSCRNRKKHNVQADPGYARSPLRAGVREFLSGGRRRAHSPAIRVHGIGEIRAAMELSILGWRLRRVSSPL